MEPELVFYTHPMSRARIVRWMLEEVGETYRDEPLDYGGSMKSPEYLRINPMGKVPAIRHGDTVVTEVAAICAYLADAFPAAGLAPEPARRGAYYRWLFFLAGPFEAATSNRFLGFETPADKEPTVGYGRYENLVDTLEQAVSASEYIAGDRFTAADVVAGSVLGWFLHLEMLEPRPAFVAYAGRVSDREARRRAEAIDDALQAEAGSG